MSTQQMFDEEWWKEWDREESAHRHVNRQVAAHLKACARQETAQRVFRLGRSRRVERLAAAGSWWQS